MIYLQNKNNIKLTVKFLKSKNKPVTLRTLDIGSDKEVSENMKVGQIAKNPALGLRASDIAYMKKIF